MLRELQNALILQGLILKVQPNEKNITVEHRKYSNYSLEAIKRMQLIVFMLRLFSKCSTNSSLNKNKRVSSKV